MSPRLQAGRGRHEPSARFSARAALQRCPLIGWSPRRDTSAALAAICRWNGPSWQPKELSYGETAWRTGANGAGPAARPHAAAPRLAQRSARAARGCAAEP